MQDSPKRVCLICGTDLAGVDRIQLDIEDDDGGATVSFLCLKHAAAIQDQIADQKLRVNPATGLLVAG